MESSSNDDITAACILHADTHPCLHCVEPEFDSLADRLEIGFDGIIPKYGWKKFGLDIGRNTRLKELLFYDLDEEVIRSDLLADVFLGVASNRSVSSLSFSYCDLVDRDVFHVLSPFFKFGKLERLSIVGCDLGRVGLSFLTKALAGFSSLRAFELSQCVADDDGACIQALRNHPALKKLVLRENRLGLKGCTELAALLKHPNTKISSLNIAESSLCDSKLAALATGLATSSTTTLRDLDISNNPGITAAGWAATFPGLLSQTCRLEDLSLGVNSINNAAVIALVSALVESKTIKVLDLSYLPNITIEGWLTLFEFLRTPDCTLEEINLRSNEFDQEVAGYLACYLACNKSLQSLDLSSNWRISVEGWSAFSSVLGHSGLKSLCLSSNGITDATMQSIATRLSKNKTLQVLSLSGNTITAAGWRAFSVVIENPCSGLQIIDLAGLHINDETIITFAHSLVNNRTLKELLTDGFHWNVTSVGWAALSKTLCDTSSIMSTFDSNHSLQRLCPEDMEIILPDGIRALLEINRECTREEAAAEKIIKTHFSPEGIEPLHDFDAKVLPHAVEWIARDCKFANRTWASRLCLLYRFSRQIGVPLLFARTSDTPKAKRRKLNGRKET